MACLTSTLRCSGDPGGGGGVTPTRCVVDVQPFGVLVSEQPLNRLVEEFAVDHGPGRRRCVQQPSHRPTRNALGPTRFVGRLRRHRTHRCLGQRPRWHLMQRLSLPPNSPAPQRVAQNINHEALNHPTRHRVTTGGPKHHQRCPQPPNPVVAARHNLISLLWPACS